MRTAIIILLLFGGSCFHPVANLIAGLGRILIAECVLLYYGIQLLGSNSIPKAV